MIDALPILLFVTVGGLWIYTTVVSARLIRLFVQQLPEVAREHLPGAFVRGLRQPELIFFFLRRNSDIFLRQDARVWTLTRHFRLCTLLSGILPPAGFIIVGIAVYVLSKEIV